MLLNYIIKGAKKYLKDFDEEKFREAYGFAREAHAGQKRKSGSPYLVHPLETTEVLLKFRVDQPTLMAAMLHDVPEDTACTLSQIEKKFGKEVAFLINGVTKLSKVYYRHKMAERQIESLKKLFLHSAKDIRIILIKLADRLHNMRTLEYVDRPSKRTRIATETIEIYVPIANLLGIWEIKSELEDLCFSFLYPKECALIKSQIKQTREKQNHILQETIKEIQEELKKVKLSAEVHGRQKTLYSLFTKIKEKKIRLTEVNDLLAIRVVVNKAEDCYRVVGIIHQIFKPKPGRFKDYIAMPKPNGYQSLHTTVFGIGGVLTEFQIRAKEMDLEAEYGIAAHYFYKEHKKSKKSLVKVVEERSNWVGKILELQKEQKNHQEFIKDLKVDIFQDRIFIFTPKGDVLDLPQRATVLDFAYEIHTEIGNKTKRAEVNGIEVPLNTALETGDTVKVITSSKQKGPKREWLDFVVTNDARNRIKEFFRKKSRQNKIDLGIEVLKKEFAYIDRNFEAEFTKRNVQPLLKKWDYADADELLMAVGVGVLEAKEVLKELYRHLNPKVLVGKEFRRPVGKQEEINYSIALKVYQKDAVGALKRLTTVIVDLGINILKSTTLTDIKKNIATTKMYLEVKNYDQVAEIFRTLNDVEDVYKVERICNRRMKPFILMSVATVLVWLLHPVMLYFEITKFHFTKWFLTISLYIGFALILVLIWMLKIITRKSFPEFKRTWFYWSISLGMTLLALLLILWESMVFGLQVNWLIALGIAMLFFAYLVAELVEYHRESKEWRKR